MRMKFETLYMWPVQPYGHVAHTPDVWVSIEFDNDNYPLGDFVLC